jgi:hypothetical protein
MDPDIVRTYLDDIRAHMDNMGSSMISNQFMMHITNNLTKDNEMQVLKLEDQIGLKTDGLEIEDMWGELNLCYEMGEHGKERALFGRGQFKGRCNSCGKYGYTQATN